MNRPGRSIQGRLFVWILGVTALFQVAIGLFVYREVREIAFGAVDKTLHSKMQVLTGLLHEEHGSIELELNEVVSGEYSIPQSGHYYKVMVDGKPLAAAPSLVDGRFDLTAGVREAHDARLKETTYTSTGPDGEPIRVLQHDLDAFGRTFNFYVAERLTDSLEMIREFGRFLLIVIPAGILVVSLMAFRISRQALKPINLFSGRIRAITHDTLGERLDAGGEARELAGLADSFNAMLDRLQKVFESEKRLIADASHELKTPVAVIGLQCDVLLQRERTAAEYIETVREIKAVAETIDTLVKDLLSLSRLDSGILSSGDFKPLSLNGCIRNALAMLEPFARDRSIRVETTLGHDVTVSGNAESLTEALFNIMENGVKYNADNGLLQVAVASNGNDAVVSVRDTGAGIAEADAGRVFDRFYRADTARNAEGTGLGLSIAKAVIEAHGGTIGLESKPGKGSIFTVSLPGLAAGPGHHITSYQEGRR